MVIKLTPNNSPTSEKNTPTGESLPVEGHGPTTSSDSPLAGSLPSTFRPTDLDKQAEPANASVAHPPTLSDGAQLVPNTGPSTTHSDSKEPERESFMATTKRTLRNCKDTLLSTFFYSTTGVMAQGTSVGMPDPSFMPNPFAYSMVRSFFAGLTTFKAAKKGLPQLGRGDLGMATLVGVSSTLWIPAFMFTDLASSMVIAFSAPLMHAAYEGLTKRKLPSPITTLSLGATTAALYTIYQGGQHAGELAMLGNAAALAATLCLATYRILVGKAAQEARESNDPAVQQATKEKLDAMSFVSNAISFGIGAATVPLASGGLGLKPLRTLALGALHGIFGGAAIHHNTRANQQLSQVTTSLIGSLQVGLTPALGYLLWGKTVPDYALVGGLLTFAASGLAILDRWRHERKQNRTTPESK